MAEPQWRIIEDKSADHWLELEDPAGWYDAVVKWDGCVELTQYSNAPKTQDRRSEDADDGMHICDVDAHIARLQALKAIAEQWYGVRRGGWPG